MFKPLIRKMLGLRHVQQEPEDESEALQAIRHKAESNEALDKARRQFLNGPSFRQVMPRFDGVEL